MMEAAALLLEPALAAPTDAVGAAGGALLGHAAPGVPFDRARNTVKLVGKTVVFSSKGGLRLNVRDWEVEFAAYETYKAAPDTATFEAATLALGLRPDFGWAFAEAWMRIATGRDNPDTYELFEWVDWMLKDKTEKTAFCARLASMKANAGQLSNVDRSRLLAKRQAYIASLGGYDVPV